MIAESVRRRVEDYAEAIGQHSTSRFQQDVVEAILICVAVHMDAPNRKRYSDIRNELLRVSKEAIAAEKSFDRLSAAIGKLTPNYRELLRKRLELPAKVALTLVTKQPPWFHALSLVASIAALFAEALRQRDKGGAPKMLAFDILVRGLARAYQHATGRAAKVTWNEHRYCYEGRFFNLVEAVLPSARALAGKEPPMRFPNTPLARGKYIYDVTRVGAKTKASAPR